MESNGRVSILDTWEGALHAETWVMWRRAQCDDLNEAHPRSCGRKELGSLISRKEIGRTSVWLEGRGGEEGCVVGEEVEELDRMQILWELRFYSPVWRDVTGGFWGGERHTLKHEEWPVGKHMHQLNGFNLDIYWKEQKGLPFTLDLEGEEKCN